MKHLLTFSLCLAAVLVFGSCKGEKKADETSLVGWQTIRANGFEFLSPSEFHRLKASEFGDAVDPGGDLLVIEDDMPKTYIGFEVHPIAGGRSAAEEFRLRTDEQLAIEGTTLVSQAADDDSFQMEMKMTSPDEGARHVWWAMKTNGALAFWLYYVVDASEEEAFAPYADEIIASIRTK